MLESVREGQPIRDIQENRDKPTLRAVEESECGREENITSQSAEVRDVHKSRVDRYTFGVQKPQRH
jgi:hypothetical protein